MSALTTKTGAVLLALLALAACGMESTEHMKSVGKLSSQCKNTLALWDDIVTAEHLGNMKEYDINDMRLRAAIKERVDFCKRNPQGAWL